MGAFQHFGGKLQSPMNVIFTFAQAVVFGLVLIVTIERQIPGHLQMLIEIDS